MSSCTSGMQRCGAGRSIASPRCVAALAVPALHCARSLTLTRGSRLSEARRPNACTPCMATLGTPCCHLPSPVPQASTRQHIVEGLLLASEQIDGIVDTVKVQKDQAAAKKALTKHPFNLSVNQSEAVLSLQVLPRQRNRSLGNPSLIPQLFCSTILMGCLCRLA